ncbi:MAG TPA: AIM24 family protein [Candidatus Dormibacteraeota bacterium]
MPEQSPHLMPTSVPDGQAPGVAYRVEGELVPVLHCRLDGTNNVYFEHHVVLWKSPEMKIGMRRLKGSFKRVVAGMQIFMTEAESGGDIAFSRDGSGHILPLHLMPGQGIAVREHQFLAATGNVEYGFKRVKGISNMFFGGTGFFIDDFTATNSEGVVWLHGYGNIFEIALAAGEEIDVEPGGWIYRDHSVKMSQNVYGLKTGLLGGSGKLIFNRFTGPGRVGIQSMYIHLPTAD